jgi:apolipoprotein N-acyltransferase
VLTAPLGSLAVTAPLAVTSGILLVLIHPKFDLVWLAPLAITPLIYALAQARSYRHRFLLGYLTGLVFWAGINYWIQFVMAVHGHMGWAGGTAVWILFLLLKAVQLGIFGLIGGVLVHSRFAVPLVAALWVAVERVPGFFGYTWLTLGNAGIDMAIPMRLAPFTGVYGLSFVFATIGVSGALVALRRPRAELSWMFLIALPFGLPDLPGPIAGTRHAIVLQPNLPEEKEWTQPEATAMQKRLEYLTLQAVLSPGQPKPDIVLWPEVPAPVYYYDDPALRDRLHTLARLSGIHLLIGTVAQNEQGPLNSALLISPSGEAAGRYDKMFLVPFGEYIPFPFADLVKKVTKEVGDFVPGTRVVVFDIPGGRIGPFICYESAIPHLVRRFEASGGTVFANVSNDGYFGKTAAREQHLSLVRMRAAENRRWILRATNDGITASIDPAGRIIQRLDSFKEVAARLSYSHESSLTPYGRYGDVFAWVCLALPLLALALRARRRN